MGKSILGCTKNDFLLDPRTPEGEQYYAENPNLLYLIRQSYGGKYPNNDEGTGDTPWTTMPNCVAYAWARCMEIWVPQVEAIPAYTLQSFRDTFNNGQPFYSGLDWLRKVYNIDVLAQGNAEDMISRIYTPGTTQYMHMDYTIPWLVDYRQYSHAGQMYLDNDRSSLPLDITAASPASFIKSDIYATYPTEVCASADQLKPNLWGFGPNYNPQWDQRYIYSRLIGNGIYDDGFARMTGQSMFAPMFWWPSAIDNMPDAVAAWPVGSILVFASGNLGLGRAGHVMVVEDGSDWAETQMKIGDEQYTVRQVLPHISDANIPHGNWGRIAKYYNWLNYAGGNNNPYYDKVHHCYHYENNDYLLAVLWPPEQIAQTLGLYSTLHRRRFGKGNLLQPKTLRRIHAGIQDYTPE